MNIDITKIISASELSINVSRTRAILEEKEEIIVFDNNKPQFVICHLFEENQKLNKTQQNSLQEEAGKSYFKNLATNNQKGIHMNENAQKRKQSKITPEMVTSAYPFLKDVWHNKITRQNAKTKIAENTGMNAGSAQALITIFLSMMNGEVYKRAFNNYATQYLLENIFVDYGKEQFLKAMQASKLHLKYYDTLGKGHLYALEQLLQELDEKYLK